MDAVDFKNLLFSFRGRINRAKWWLGLLLLLVYSVVASIVAVVTLGNSLTSDFNFIVFVGIGILLIAYIVAMVASFAVGVKRLHDRNKSGWWTLLFYVLPWVLVTIGEALGESPAALLLMLVVLAIYIWAFVEIVCLRGTVGPNKYGPDPLETDVTQPAVAA